MKKETQSQKKFCQKTKITKFDVHSLTFDADVLCNEMKLKDRWNTKRDECLFAQKKKTKKDSLFILPHFFRDVVDFYPL